MLWSIQRRRSKFFLVHKGEGARGFVSFVFTFLANVVLWTAKSQGISISCWSYRIIGLPFFLFIGKREDLFFAFRGGGVDRKGFLWWGEFLFPPALYRKCIYLTTSTLWKRKEPVFNERSCCCGPTNHNAIYTTTWQCIYQTNYVEMTERISISFRTYQTVAIFLKTEWLFCSSNSTVDWGRYDTLTERAPNWLPITKPTRFRPSKDSLPWPCISCHMVHTLLHEPLPCPWFHPADTALIVSLRF